MTRAVLDLSRCPRAGTGMALLASARSTRRKVPSARWARHGPLLAHLSPLFISYPQNGHHSPTRAATPPPLGTPAAPPTSAELEPLPELPPSASTPASAHLGEDGLGPVHAADLQTLASPDPRTLESSPMEEASLDPASASTKKKKKDSKKKRKAVDDLGAASPDPIDVTVDASTKKKSSKKRKVDDDLGVASPEPIDVTVDASSPEPIDVTVDASAKKKSSKKRKVVDDLAAAAPESINVTVDASLAGGSAAAAAPVVAYFPTGYNPLAAGSEASSARLFRNTKHPSRVDLVVRSPGGGPDFVGRSYTGEAALPQLCNYALGVLDKACGTLKVVRIASDKVLRLEPYLEQQKPAHSQQSGLTSEAGSAVATDEMKVQDLTSMYGAKKDKDTDKKWKSLLDQRNDPSAYMDLDLGNPETNTKASDNAPVIFWNIPPYDPTADTSETAYLFDEIIPKNIRSHLLEILGHLESEEFSSKGYGSFVSNRVHKLEKLEGEDKERLAWILSYITHLLTLLERNSSMSKRHRKENKTTKAPVIPQAVYRNLMIMFTEEGSSALSTEKKELLINYILVLTLFADDFRSDPTDILADLKMTRQMIKPYYDQLGCKAESTGAFKPTFMTLPAPLKFPKEVTRRKRRG